MRPYLTILFIMGISLNIYSQIKFDDKSRAVFIFDIVKYITWPNETAIDTFYIAVLDTENKLEAEMLKVAEQRGLVHKKPVKVARFSSIETIGKCNALFANNENGWDIDKILKKISGKQILLATENYAFHKSMVNFIIVNNYQRYEVNESKLKEEGFNANELFVAGSVKSLADWEKLYKQTDIQLQKEKEIVEAQNIEIEKQKKQITEQSERIAAQKAEIELQMQEIQKQKAELTIVMSQVGVQQKLLIAKTEELNKKETELITKSEEILKKSKILEEQHTEIELQQGKIEGQKKVLNEQLAKIEMQQLILYLFIAIIVLVSLMGFFIFKAYKVKKTANILLKAKNQEIMEQNEEIRQQKEEIEAQRDEIEKQNEELEIQKNFAEKQRDEIGQQKEEIMASIHYASRIQTAVLPPAKFITQILPDHFFILNKPRDIVSGDYYWMAQKDNKTVIAAADCTGHGVPGAFMSLLGVSFLNEVINKVSEVLANDILDKLRDSVINALNQAGTEGVTKDGMDMALCVLDLNSYELQFAGANNPLYIIRTKNNFNEPNFNNSPKNSEEIDNQNVRINDFPDSVLLEFKADKMPIGLYDESKPFANKFIQLIKNDVFYIFSDGYADQFGGPQGKKFKYKQMKELLISIQEQPMTEQKNLLDKAIEDWRGDYFQVDDMLIIGVKV